MLPDARPLEVAPEVAALPVLEPGEAPVDAAPLDGAPPEAPLAAWEVPLVAPAPLPWLPEPPASPFSAPFDEHASSAVTPAHKQMRFGIRASELAPSINGIRPHDDRLCVLPDSSADTARGKCATPLRSSNRHRLPQVQRIVSDIV